MILVAPPRDVSPGTYVLLGDDVAFRLDYHEALRASTHPPRVPFVHWSLLTDEERDRAWEAISPDAA